MRLSGSVEVMIALGVADAVVDLVETGSTLAANRLRIFDELGTFQTVLIQNTQTSNPELADRVVRRLEGVVIARSYSLLEYNIRRDRLTEAEEITPGFNSPTISSLEDENWCAVRVMVRPRRADRRDGAARAPGCVPPSSKRRSPIVAFEVGRLSNNLILDGEPNQFGCR